MRTSAMLAAVLASQALSAFTLTAEPMTFDTADSVKTWSFANGPEFPGATGKIEWDAAAGHDKPGCLGLRFSFQGGGNYVQASCALPADNNYRFARLWMSKPAGNRVTFRVVDSSSQTFQKSADFVSDGWQQVEVDLTRWSHWFGGAGTGKIRKPLTAFAVLVENTGAQKEGTVLIDDLEFGTSAAPSPEVTTTYIAWDPQSTIGWGARGGAGNTFDKGTWNYAFSGQSSPSLHTGFSLLGRSAGMKLFVENDGSGHEVFVTLGSHFQNFRKQVGRLSGDGPQTIDVPLGDLKDWEHFGGENDGQARMPLRVLEISLKRGNGPERGALRLTRVEAETTLPAGQTVVLSPDVEQQGNQAVFKVEIQNLQKSEAKGEVICGFRQLYGVEYQNKTFTLPPAGGTPTSLEFSSRRASHHAMMEGTFWWVEGGDISEPASIGMSMPLGESGSTALDPSSPFGVGLYLYRWNGHPQARAKMNELATLARKAGVKWTREEIDWHITEPRKGEYNWTFYDDLVDVAHANGISIYGLLCYWSHFARKDTPEGVEEYCQWARQVVRHYKGRIKHWEIWNEPNIFFWTGPKELYFTLLAKAYEAIKAEDPEAQVLGCSTAGIDIDFIKRTMAAGARFDALTIHPYRGELNDLDFIKELRDVKALVGGRPVWITEMGWPSDRPYGRTERQQASYVARTYLTSVASGAVASVSWYDFRNDGNDPYYNEYNFGMVRNDLRLKPAYRALATIANTLAGMKVVEQIDLGPDAYGFRFSDGKADVVAACAPQTGRLLAFRGEQTPWIISTFGERLRPVVADGISVVTLDTGMPVYIKSKAGFEFRPTDPPVKLTVDRRSIRPGDTVAVRIEPDLVGGWRMPLGWPVPKPELSGQYKLSIPAHARPGDIELEVIVMLGTKPVRLPVKLTVQAKVVRV